MSKHKIEQYMDILNILDNEDFLSEEKRNFYNFIIHSIFDRMPSLEYYE